MPTTPLVRDDHASCSELGNLEIDVISRFAVFWVDTWSLKLSGFLRVKENPNLTQGKQQQQQQQQQEQQQQQQQQRYKQQKIPNKKKKL